MICLKTLKACINLKKNMHIKLCASYRTSVGSIFQYFLKCISRSEKKCEKLEKDLKSS